MKSNIMTNINASMIMSFFLFPDKYDNTRSRQIFEEIMRTLVSGKLYSKAKATNASMSAVGEKGTSILRNN